MTKGQRNISVHLHPWDQIIMGAESQSINQKEKLAMVYHEVRVLN